MYMRVCICIVLVYVYIYIYIYIFIFGEVVLVSAGGEWVLLGEGDSCFFWVMHA